MAIDFLQTKKRQQHLVLILALVICLALVVVWQNFLKKTPTVPAVVSPILFPTEIKMNWGALQNAKLSELKPFVEIPPFGEKVGRKDPFVPYK